MRLLRAIKVFFAELSGKQEAEIPPKEGDTSHLKLLYLLQKKGRLIDFLKEDISQFSDAEVGAAVRKIHEECDASLEEWVNIRPLFSEREGSTITIPRDYDAAKIKVVGRVKGKPPFEGVLRHRGWEAKKRELPSMDSSVLCPAEVDVQ